MKQMKRFIQRNPRQIRLGLLAFVVVLSLSIGIVYANKNFAAAIDSGLSYETTGECYFDGSTYYSPDNITVTYNRNGQYTKVKTSFDASSEEEGFEPINPDGDTTLTATAGQNVSIQLANEDLSVKSPVYTFKVASACPTLSATLSKTAPWKYNISASACNVPYQLYYTINHTYNNVDQIKGGATETGKALTLEESASQVTYTIYAVDVFNRFTKVTLDTLDVVDYSAPKATITYDGEADCVDGVHYYGASSDRHFISVSIKDEYSAPTFEPFTSDDFITWEQVLMTGASINVNARAVNAMPHGYTNTWTTTAKDGCGNSATITVGPIVYDNVAPEITNLKLNNVVYEPTGTPIISNRAQNFTFHVEEDNLKSVTAKLGSEDISVTSLGNGNYRASVAQDVVSQRLKVTVLDKAGQSSSFTTDLITLDMTALEVISCKVNSEELQGGTVFKPNNEFEITLSDSDVGTLKLKAVGTTGSPINIPFTILDDKITGSFDIQTEDTYYLHLDMQDLSGNVSEYDSPSFNIDNASPVLGLSSDGNVFTMTLAERNPQQSNMVDSQFAFYDSLGDLESVKFRIGEHQYEGSPTYVASVVANGANWSKTEDGTYVLSMTIETEANYKVTASSTDMVGNTSGEKSLNFTIDGTKPRLVKAEFSELKKGYDDYQYISKNPIVVDIETFDDVSNIKSVVLTYTTVDGKSQKLKAKKQDTWEYQYIFGETVGTKGKLLSISVTDTCGNTEVVAFDNGIIVDKETEDIELLNLSIKDDAEGVSVVNRDISLTMNASDTYSGLAHCKYTINGKANDSDYTASNKMTFTKTYNDKIIAKENEGDNIEVRLEATDNAGNEAYTRKTYSIDTTAPSIDVSFDRTTDNNYYNSTRVATIVVKDKHFVQNGVDFNLIVDDKTQPYTLSFRTKDDETYTASVPFDTDGVYSFNLIVTDKAGNSTTYANKEPFTIDKTAPTMEITYDNNSASNNNYYSNSRTATIKIVDRNFDAKLVELDISGSNGSPSVSAFSSSGDVHTAVVSFSVDGEYSIGGSVTDLAGNKSNTVATESFIIDQTAPEIKISNVSSGASYNDSVTPSIEATDTNYDSMEVSVNGARYGSHNDFSATRSTRTDGESVAYADFERVDKNDDVYTLTAKAIDKAGNETNETISFRVNRFGSTYSFDSYTKKAIEDYYISPTQDFVIIEENVDALKESSVYYTVNGDITELDENKDYKVKRSENSDGWNEYSYNIHSDSLTNDGIYTFSVYSKDAAGNETDNKTKDTPFVVCVDKTAPVVALTGVKKDQVYEQESLDVSVDVTDNILLQDVVVVLNGEEQKYKGEDITDGVIPLSIKESNKTQSLQVEATDAAGNTFETDEYTFMVSTSKIVTSTANAMKSPIFWIFISIAIIGIIGTTIFVVVRNKKKEEE